MKRFSAHEMELLLENPYVLKVTHTKIYFTLEFKLLAYKRIQAGYKMRDIVSEIGIDPEILGEGRMTGMRSNLLHEATSNNGLSDITRRHHNMSTEDRIHYLENQLAYKEQEIAFLKKIVSLGVEEPQP